MGQICSSCFKSKKEESADKCGNISTNSISPLLQNNQVDESIQIKNEVLCNDVQDSVLEEPEENDVSSKENEEIISKLSNEVEILEISETPEECTKDLFNYSIIEDTSVIEYLKRCQVLAVIRGVSGSGKSTLAQKVKDVYEDSVICSADDYFMQEGVYQFDHTKLKFAHEDCQEKARHHMEMGTNVVIIDNTNVKLWEMKVYREMAKSFNYTVLYVEVQTPWCKNPEELSKRTRHDVPLNILQEKVATFEALRPLYYGWFINQEDSRLLFELSRMWFKNALQIPRFYQNFESLTGCSDIEDILSFFHNKNTSLHCTSFFLKDKDVPQDERDRYMNNPHVKSAVGKTFNLDIIGWVLTPRSFGARVHLSESQLRLWNQNDDEELSEDFKYPFPSNEDITNEHFDLPNIKNVQIHSQKSTLKYTSTNYGSYRFCPTFGMGSRAHLTIATAPAIPAKTTGLDLAMAIKKEQKVKDPEFISDAEDASVGVETYQLGDSIVKLYDDQTWVIYPHKKVSITTLFNCL